MSGVSLPGHVIRYTFRSLPLLYRPTLLRPRSYNSHRRCPKDIFRISLLAISCSISLPFQLRSFNPRSLLEKIVTGSLERGGGGHRTPPSTFDKIHPIDLKFGTYNKLHLYFQLSETTWCITGFRGNNSQITDVTGSRHLGFSNFQILIKFSLFYLRLTGKQHLAVEIHEIGRVHCEVVSI